MESKIWFRKTRGDSYVHTSKKLYVFVYKKPHGGYAFVMKNRITKELKSDGLFCNIFPTIESVKTYLENYFNPQPS